MDLWEAATAALRGTGRRARSQVVNPRLCTVCNSDLFYSYRAEGPVTGRQGCVAWSGGSRWTSEPGRRLRANLAAAERADRGGLRAEPAGATVPGCWWPPSTWRSEDMALLRGQESGLWGRTGQKNWRRSGGGGARRSSSTSSVICRVARCGRCCRASPWSIRWIRCRWWRSWTGGQKPRVKVLLEVNVSGEESKYGILPAAAETFLERAAAYGGSVSSGS